MRSIALLVIVGGIGCSSGGAPSGYADLAARARDLGEARPDLAPTADLAPSIEPDWDRITAYLDLLYNPNLALLREYPAANTYYTSDDNALAARAYEYLPTPNLPRRDAILGALRSYKICGCGDIAEHDAVLNHHIDPVTTRGAQIPLTPRSACNRTPESESRPTASCGSSGSSCPSSRVGHRDHPSGDWLGDDCNFGICGTTTQSGFAASGPGKGSADLIALQILNLRNRGMPTDTLWQSLLGKWDGKGVYDQAAVNDHAYTTYKVALLKLCARVLSKPLPMGVDEKLQAAQGANGGIRTSYALDGNFTLDQLGNAVTTSYVVLAFRKPVSDF